MPRGPSFLVLLLVCITFYSTFKVEASSPMQMSLADLKENDVPRHPFLDLTDDDKKSFSSTEEDSEPGNRSSLPAALQIKPTCLSRRPGMINHNLFVCYLNSVVTSLFSATPFRRLIYTTTPTNIVTAVLAETFARLQTVTGSIGTLSTLMKAFKMQYSDWDFKVFQCSLEFAYNILDIMPNSANFSFALTRHSVLNTPRSEEVYNAVVAGNATFEDLSTRVVTSKSETNPLITTAPCYPSIQHAFDSGFRDDIYESRILESDFNRMEGLPPVSDSNKEINSTRFDFVSIANAPEVFSFGIKRVQWTLMQTINFVNQEMIVNPEIIIKTEAGETHRYLLQAFAHYVDHHYISYQCDYTENDGRGQWYRFNDNEVHFVSTEEELDRMWRIASIAATFVVYVREDQVARSKEAIPEVPEAYLKLARFTHELQSIHQSNLLAAQARVQAESEAQARAQAESEAQARSRAAAARAIMQNISSLLPPTGLLSYTSKDRPNLLRTEFDRMNAIPRLILDRFQPSNVLDANMAPKDADVSSDTELLRSILDDDSFGRIPEA